MRTDFLPFSPPLIGEEEIEEVVATLRSQWITTGPRVKRFETAFTELTGAPAALALSSCTAGLHVALVAAGVGAGDTVISTPMTFCSSIHVIEHTGARPVLADVSPDTLNLDPEAARAAVDASEGTARALLPVHLYGHPADVDALGALARENDLVIVEDAAHGFPAAYRGRPVGAPMAGVRNLTAFSFYATKNLTTAEGGMLTGPEDLIERARMLSLHGMSRDAYKRYTAEGSWYYEVLEAGFKYNMTDIQAALGLVQLTRLEAMQERRRRIVRLYNEAFADLEEVELPAARAEVDHAWHIYALRLNLDRLTIDRARFIEELAARRIGSSVHFIPVHLHPYYRDKYGWRPEDFPVASAHYRRLVSLPLNPVMTEADAADVVEAVTAVAAGHRA